MIPFREVYIHRILLVPKEPPLPPPSPLLFILSKGAQYGLLLVEVSTSGISTFSGNTSTNKVS
jgi:hypothetical protein